MIKKILCFFISAILFNLFITSSNFVFAKNHKQTNAKTTLQEKEISVVKKIDINSYPNRINIIFSDIDGTLIPFDSNDTSYIPSSVIDSIKILEDFNITLVLVSGRSLYEVKQIADSLGLKKTYLVGNQGAEILTSQGGFIPIGGFSKSVLDKVLAEVNDFNKKNNSDIFPFIHANGKVYVFKEITLPISFDEYIVIKSTNDIGDNFDAVKIGLHSYDKTLLLKLAKDLKEKFPNYNIVNSAPTFVDFLSKETSKGFAIKHITSKLNISLKHVAVFGDAENDISMLNLVAQNGGLAVAVDNASQNVKDNANYITDSVSNDGFFNTVLLIVKNNKRLTPVRNNVNPTQFKRY